MFNMRTWKSVELSKADADKFRVFLKENGIKYEASGCFNLIHFQVHVNDTETNNIDAFLETI